MHICMKTTGEKFISADAKPPWNLENDKENIFSYETYECNHIPA